MKDYIISKAQPTDAVELRKLNEKVWIDTYPNKEIGITKDDIISLNFAGPERIQKMKDTLVDIQNNPNAHFMVAKKDGKIVGYCWSIKGEGGNEIKSLYVDPEFQSKGIGKLLTQDAFEFLSGEDIFLWVATYNEKAINFYRKFGFEKTGELDSNVLACGKAIPIVKMIKLGIKDRP